MTRNRHQSALYARLRPRVKCQLRTMRNTPHLGNSISQDKLAAITGIPKSTISQIETGAQLPRTLQLVALSEALGCSINDLITVIE